MPEHSTLTGSSLHEPKGVATATAGDIYEADGAGSGAWVSTTVTSVESVNNTGTAQATVSGVAEKLENDGLGFSYEDYGPALTTSWDPSTNTFDWASAGWQIGDTCILSFEVEVVTTSANDETTFQVDFAVGGSFPFTKHVGVRYEKVTGTHLYGFATPFFITADSLAYPAQMCVITDNSSNTVKMLGHTTFHTPKVIRRS